MARWADYQRCPQCGTVLELEVSRKVQNYWDPVKDKIIHENEFSYYLVCPECRWEGKQASVADVMLSDYYEEETIRPWKEVQ